MEQRVIWRRAKNGTDRETNNSSQLKTIGREGLKKGSGGKKTEHKARENCHNDTQ